MLTRSKVVGSLVVVATALLTVAPFAQAETLPQADQDPIQAEELEAVRQAADQLGEAARSRLAPLPEGQVRVLQAVIMSVNGRAQWRPNEASPWREARIDDLLDPGALIRTGRDSQVVLRVGQNATVLVDRNTRLAVPEIVYAGDTLRTSVQLERGRADFKVDHVGPVNDFSVVTPSTTLAVRGTAYAVEYGGFDGTQVYAVSSTRLLAIEVRYFLSLYTYYLSTGSVTADTSKNPVVAALFRTFGPPMILTAMVEDIEMSELLIDALRQSPVSDMRRVDLSNSSFRNTLGLSIFDAVEAPVVDDDGNRPRRPRRNTRQRLPVLDPDDYQFGDANLNRPRLIVQFLCAQLNPVFYRYRQYMIQDGLGAQGIDQPRLEIESLCETRGGRMLDEDLQRVFESITRYCELKHGNNPNRYRRCVDNFVRAFNNIYENAPSARGRVTSRP